MKQEGRNRIKQVCADTDKYEKKIIGQEFLLGKFFKTKSIQRKSTKYTSTFFWFRVKDRKIAQHPRKDDHSRNIIRTLQATSRAVEKLCCRTLIVVDPSCRTADDPELKLLRADYHGASIKIIHSPITTYIGLEGIIINESLKTFKLIKRNNQIITLLKNAIVFEL